MELLVCWSTETQRHMSARAHERMSARAQERKSVREQESKRARGKAIERESAEQRVIAEMCERHCSEGQRRGKEEPRWRESERTRPWQVLEIVRSAVCKSMY